MVMRLGVDVVDNYTIENPNHSVKIAILNIRKQKITRFV